MFKKALLILVMLMLVALPVHARQVASEGTANASGLYDISIDEDHYITFNGGIYAKYELKTTNDTLTAIETGTHYTVEPVPGSPVTITLPDADVGLQYSFTQGSVTGDAGKAKWFELDPQSTDIIVHINSNATNTFVAGDKIRNQGYTADSLQIICTKDLYWQVISARGTWSDSN